MRNDELYEPRVCGFYYANLLLTVNQDRKCSHKRNRNKTRLNRLFLIKHLLLLSIKNIFHSFIRSGRKIKLVISVKKKYFLIYVMVAVNKLIAIFQWYISDKKVGDRYRFI